MDLSHFKASTEEGVYTFQINDIIGSVIDGGAVGREIAYINEYAEGKVKRIDIKINSEGGSITNGIKIISAMLESIIPVKTINMGYACSMAGVIFIAGHKGLRNMVDFGILMIHNPRFKGVDMQLIDDPKELQILTLMKEQMIKVMAGKSTLSKEELSTMMDDEAWMDFEKAKSYGFVDGKPIVFKNAPQLARAATTDIKLIEEFYQNNIINKSKRNQMDVELTKQFEARINERDSTIETQATNIVKMQDDYKALKSDYENVVTEKDKAIAEATELKGEVTLQGTVIQDFKDNQSVTMVENAIEKGLFAKEKKDELVIQAKADPKSFKAIVDMMTPAADPLKGKDAPKISELIKFSEALAEIKEEDLNGMTKFEYLQRNDSKKLEEMKRTNLAVYEALKEEYLNQAPKN